MRWKFDSNGGQTRRGITWKPGRVVIRAIKHENRSTSGEGGGGCSGSSLNGCLTQKSRVFSASPLPFT